eukprot:2548843-Prorocentrum_lima.AAC.1
MDMLAFLISPCPSKPVIIPGQRGVLQKRPRVGVWEPRPRPNVVHRQEVEEEGRRCQAAVAIEPDLSQGVGSLVPRMHVMTLDVHCLNYANRLGQRDQVGDKFVQLRVLPPAAVDDSNSRSRVAAEGDLASA